MFYEAVGHLGLDRRALVPLDALFAIASITKPVTGVDVMRLVRIASTVLRPGPGTDGLTRSCRGQARAATSGPCTYDSPNTIMHQPTGEITMKITEILAHPLSVPYAPAALDRA